ncbi:FHA domain-containing protein [Planctomycetales bacterium 10988]|nr:FHA domain-containing protein [Planctomycetales bacterium 10988]
MFWRKKSTATQPCWTSGRFANKEDHPAETLSETNPPERFLLWIDEVGSVLVCTSDTITIGHPQASPQPTFALWAAIASQEVTIRRDASGYLIDPLLRPGKQPPKSNDVPFEEPQNLQDGDLISLSGGVEFRFRQPHALSQSARLELLSSHRTQPTVDGVVLMADSLILGPVSSSHLVIPDAKEECLIYRNAAGKLHCRTKNRTPGERVESFPLEKPTQLEVGNLNFSYEPIASNSLAARFA